MTLLYTINWKKIDDKPSENFITINITCLDKSGKVINIVKNYEEWIGVCTSDIKLVVSKMKYFFPGTQIRYERIDISENNDHNQNLFVKVLPYFKERLQSENFDYEKHPFYKVYLNNCDCIEDIGIFFNRIDFAYFHKTDWLTRLYIDFSTRCQKTNGFYYQWYEVNKKEHNLMDAFQMKTNLTYLPKWKFAAFDIETVCCSHGENDTQNRVPNGMDPSDKIVMISIIKWQQDCEQNILSKKEYILYLNPIMPMTSSSEENITLKPHLNLLNCENNNNRKYLEYNSEIQLLNDFHFLIKDVHILTGYNINKFDIPCIFARLLWLGQYNILNQYSSSITGDYLITTFQEKIVIDVYHYIHIFSNYDLSSFKLDAVAEIKLGGDKEERKLAIDAVGIHYWYRSPPLITKELCLSNDPKYCYNVLKPTQIASPERFGTFVQYLEYCLRDSELVFKLFRKEMILGFLTARANFGALNVVQALHFGNSRILLEIFKSYGTTLGFFLNTDYLENQSDGSKYLSMFVENKTTYQGALNYCLQKEYFNDVVVLDFTSMYPTALLSSNLCYGTCDILSAEEYSQSLSENAKNYLTAIPYRIHDDRDFQDKTIFYTLSSFHENSSSSAIDSSHFFRYPSFDPEKDKFVIVCNQHAKGFLPTLVENLINARKYHQQQWKTTQNVFHYNSQLCIKILLNSIYGTMASKDSPLAYIPIAMSIVTLARYQLLGSYHYVEKLGYKVCYADTDSLMIHCWPFDHCDDVNRFLNHLPHVELKFEHRMKRLLVLSKKRYIYELMGDASSQLHVKGFGKKVNDLIKYMTTKIINAVMKLKESNDSFLTTTVDPSDGWILWVETLREAFFMCRDPKKYSICRKTKKLDEYVSTTCAAVKMLKKYPEKQGGYIDYTYSRADVSAKQSSSWIMNVEDCQYVNFEQLFMSQKKVLITLLNLGYWNLPRAEYYCDMVLNTMRWKCFLNAELKHYFKTDRKKIMIMVEKGIKYTFTINDCFSGSNNRRKSVVVKKKRKTPIDMFEEDANIKVVKKSKKLR